MNIWIYMIVEISDLAWSLNTKRISLILPEVIDILVFRSSAKRPTEVKLEPYIQVLNMSCNKTLHVV